MAGLMTGGDYVTESGFDDRTASCFHGLDFGGIQINADNLIALVCQARGGDCPHITQTKDANPAHLEYFLDWCIRASACFWIRRESVLFKD